MKRLAAAGTFSLLAGLFSLLLVASVVYSCREGGHPHDMGTGAQQTAPSSSPAAVAVREMPPKASSSADDARPVTP